MSPATLLEAIAQGCLEAGLFRNLPADTILWRCRTRDRKQRFPNARDVGPPPAVAAKQSRMSPAGIPMFYAASDKATAEAETLRRGAKYWAIAEFKTLRELVIVDLTEVPVISMFDHEKSHI